MPPLVISGGPTTACIISYTTPTPVTLDLSCDAYALEITTDTETVDIGTFCLPGATQLGRTVYSAVLSLLWSSELYTELLANVGKQGMLNFGSTDASIGHITFSTKYVALPWGRFEIGQRVESELVLAVLSTPVWALTAPLAVESPSTPGGEPASAEA